MACCSITPCSQWPVRLLCCVVSPHPAPRRVADTIELFRFPSKRKEIEMAGSNESTKLNIVVIWGDDIGIANPSW
jgi:hypothetical protein